MSAGTAEVESALDEHPACSEAAVVGYPHPIKGEGIYAFVTLKQAVTTLSDDELRKELKNQVSTLSASSFASQVWHRTHHVNPFCVRYCTTFTSSVLFVPGLAHRPACLYRLLCVRSGACLCDLFWTRKEVLFAS